MRTADVVYPDFTALDPVGPYEEATARELIPAFR
jgi:hypothetical protein